MRTGILLGLGVGLALVAGTLAQASCPEGKSEIKITTPSGMEKTICVPDEAVPGIESAAEHADGTIIPSSCPCWDEDDIRYYLDSKILWYCKYDAGSALLTCFDFDDLEVLAAEKDGACRNNITQVTHEELTTEQWNACSKLVEGLLGT
jgi:hypothetical protein